MDEGLEKPTESKRDSDAEDNGNSSNDEDGGPDWTKLPTGISRPVIPKRGEKDFEPTAGGGSGLQTHVLNRARSAMFDALRATRNISSKNASYGIWYPSISRAHVTTARGIHFASMGHTVARPENNTASDGVTPKVHKRVELLPEEVIYLVERGALFCWKHQNDMPSNEPGLTDIDGSPMTVQQTFAEMIGTEDLTLERYQVFAYLKRLGYVVTRATPPTPVYPTPPPHNLKRVAPVSFFQRLWTYWLRIWSRLWELVTRRESLNWWKPVPLSSSTSYSSLFRLLRLIPSGHDEPLRSSQPRPELDTPYKIFYNLYKPATPFRKTAPPKPDFSVVVVNARTTPMPSLFELSALFDGLPEAPPPLPRQRKPPLKQNLPPPPAKEKLSTWLEKILPWCSLRPTPQAEKPLRHPNPFMALKAGKRNVVIAVVDTGNISLFRFGQGAFSEWRMFEY